MEASDGRSAATPSFRAFLSYSHADITAAQRLHRKLESYRLPRHMRPAGDDGRIGAIFRDREDFPAATDLSASVRKALAASQALIVLCSPDAGVSRWVAREIALFRELHPDRPILAALLCGEPEDAFPAALHHGGEPLAADLRKEGDGYRLGFLKVVAGVMDVPLDALVQRDSQRQIRRVMAVTGLACAIALMMAVMTVIALQARGEAQRQQAAAEGLIEYMLTDLREDLDGAAGVAVMTRVNQRALAYYEGQQNLTALSPDSLERRARVVGRLGEDAIFRKNYALARRNLSERARATLSLLDAAPGDPERRFDHALSLNRLAILSQAEGNGAQAEAELRQSWGLLSGVRAWRSRNPEWRRTTALVAGNLCAIDALAKAVDDATLEKCRIAVELGERLAGNDEVASRAPYDLVFNLMWQSVALEQAGRREDASSVRRQALRLADQLASENPNNRKIRSQQMEIYGYLASFEAPPIRRAMLFRALGIARELTRLDPERADWRSNLVNFRKRLEE
ncbi:toll/interleukin-1 receptor domain-containing protein [Blastomonas sp. SL216]|uniref:toll/interleukin-1 receptor domain-containing protein n=1 Tax=Blastomonas sp. SL216 TaxID=2995169 RepID=UPI0023778D98|nr:toll/interleukin-1 receptor domain-containing protein [Blastomonas sp. SL216]